MAEWLQTAAGQQYVLGIAGTLGALVLFFIVLALLRKRKGNAGRRNADDGKRRNRLAVVEINHLDDQRSFVLLRRDDIEHLVLVGGNNDLLIESGIDRAGHARRAAPPATVAAPPAAPVAVEPAPVIKPAPLAVAPVAPAPIPAPEPRRDFESVSRVELAPAFSHVPPVASHPIGETVPVPAAARHDPRIVEPTLGFSPATVPASPRPSEPSLDFAPVPLDEQAQKVEPARPSQSNPAGQRESIDAEMQRFLDDLAKGKD